MSSVKDFILSKVDESNQILAEYNNFKYWFLRKSAHKFDAIHKDTDVFVCEVDEQDVAELDPSVLIDFNSFKDFRPEYSVGASVVVDGQPAERLKQNYIELLVGVTAIRGRESGNNPDNASIGWLPWLTGTDFFTAPASTIYHESFESGLLVHSLNVYNRAVMLAEMPVFSTCSAHSYTLVALCHDWCKIGLYEKYERNVKVDGKWETVDAFKTNQIGVPLGHGASSMFLASKCFRITTDEALSLRWHMGVWRVCDSEMNELQLANEKYPLVHLIQFADQLSITSY